MKYICFKGMHWFLPVLPRFYWNKKQYNWTVNFDSSCAYDLGDDDQYDWNKLVGVSEHLNPRIHSIRFGWRYNLQNKMIEIASYKETNYKFEFNIISTVELNKNIKLNIQLYSNLVALDVSGNTYVTPFVLNNKLTIRANPYFGGNKTSPHKMSLKIS
jgi:hypothetical protein